MSAETCPACGPDAPPPGTYHHSHWPTCPILLEEIKDRGREAGVGDSEHADAIARLVAEWPPLTPEQKVNIAALMKPYLP